MEEGQVRFAIRIMLKEMAMTDRSKFRREQALGQVDVAGRECITNLSENSDSRVLTKLDSDSVSS